MSMDGKKSADVLGANRQCKASYRRGFAEHAEKISRSSKEARDPFLQHDYAILDSSCVRFLVEQ